jgi:hypothetical protein
MKLVRGGPWSFCSEDRWISGIGLDGGEVEFGSGGAPGNAAVAHGDDFIHEVFNG